VTSVTGTRARRKRQAAAIHRIQSRSTEARAKPGPQRHRSASSTPSPRRRSAQRHPITQRAPPVTQRHRINRASLDAIALAASAAPRGRPPRRRPSGDGTQLSAKQFPPRARCRGGRAVPHGVGGPQPVRVDRGKTGATPCGLRQRGLCLLTPARRPTSRQARPPGDAGVVPPPVHHPPRAISCPDTALLIPRPSAPSREVCVDAVSQLLILSLPRRCTAATW